MGKKLYVGNLSFSVDSDQLAGMFAEFGNVESANVITDRETGRSKGFAFVEMSADSEALAAIEKLNGMEFSGRAMNVSEAKPQEKRPGGGGRGGFGGGGRGGSLLVAKDDLVQVEGKVSDLSAGGVYFITLENGVPIKARLCGKMKRFNIKVVVGDRVTVGVSPYDPTHGLITHRHKF